MSNKLTRREFIATSTAAVALTVMSTKAISANRAQETTMTQTLAAAFAASHEPKPLPFDPAKLDGLSEN